MVKVIMILDNKFPSPLSPEEFVKQYYLTDVAKEDMTRFEVEQGDWSEDSCICKYPKKYWKGTYYICRDCKSKIV